MNHDLISRKALVAALIKEREQFPPDTAERYSFGAKLPNRFNQAMRGGIRKALRLVETASAVDVELVRHGRWIPVELKRSIGVLKGVECSLCGEQKVGKGYNYCPNCGAKMDAEG